MCEIQLFLIVQFFIYLLIDHHLISFFYEWENLVINELIFPLHCQSFNLQNLLKFLNLHIFLDLLPNFPRLVCASHQIQNQSIFYWVHKSLLILINVWLQIQILRLSVITFILMLIIFEIFSIYKIAA